MQLRPRGVGSLEGLLRADQLGAYGAEPRQSPFLDGLALESVLFENAWAASAQTAPSVLSILGKEPPRYMQGRPLFAAPGESAPVRGMLDPDVLNQSGAAPGALVSAPAERSAQAQRAV